MFAYIYICIYACLLITYYRVSMHFYICTVALGGDVAVCPQACRQASGNLDQVWKAAHKRKFKGLYKVMSISNS